MRYLLLLVVFFPLLVLVPTVEAQQTCYPSRVVNQWACLNSTLCAPGAMQNRCQYATGTPCTPGNIADCNNGADGACVSYCTSWQAFGTCQTTSGSVSCSAAPACNWTGNLTTCTNSSGGGTSGGCLLGGETLSYECWGPPVSTPGPSGGGGGSCSGACFSGLNNCGEVGRQPVGGSCPGGQMCCGFSLPPPCSGNGGSCSGWNDTTSCCGGQGLTCNDTGGGNYRCGRCSDPYYVNLGCGSDPALWCGQSYLCDNGWFTCPNNQSLVAPPAPSGQTPADGATVQTTATCNRACTTDLDCSSNWVEMRMNRYGGAVAKYNFGYLDAFYENNNLLDNLNSKVIHTLQPSVPTTATVANAVGGTMQYTRAQDTGFVIPTTSNTIMPYFYRAPQAAYWDLFANGKYQYSVNANSQDNPPTQLYLQATVNFPTETTFACTSNVCRNKFNTSDSTCTDDTARHFVQLVARHGGPTRTTTTIDAIDEDGVRTQSNVGSKFSTYSHVGAGAFASFVGGQFSGGSELYTTLNQASVVSFWTTANTLALISTQSSARGIWDVYVDYKFVQSVDLYAATTAYQRSFPITLPARAAVSGTEKRVDLSWPANGYKRFEIEIYPDGGSCASPGAYCGEITQARYRYLPVAGITAYQWRVRVMNSVCAYANKNTILGTWSPVWRFSIDDSSNLTSTVYADNAGAATLVGGICQLGGAAAFTQGGSVNVTKGATSLNGTVALGTGSYTVNAVPSGTGYTVRYTPGAGYACTCPVGCTYNNVTFPVTAGLPFYVSAIEDPWFQTVGGDTASLIPTVGTSVQSLVPVATCTGAACSPYFTLPGVAANPLTQGALVVGPSSQVDLKDSPGSQIDNVGSPSRLVRLKGPIITRENYDYFYRLYSLGLSPADDFTTAPQSPGNATKPCSGAGCKIAYYRNGDLTIGTPWTLVGSESIVVFVNGNLTIRANITMPVGTFVGFIVKGNITIDPTVGTSTYTQTNNGQVQGFYLADGQLTVASAGAGGTELKFIGEGTFVAAGGIRLPRDFRNGGNGIQNNTNPSSLFLYRTDLIRNAPARMRTPLFSWTEASP